MYQRKVGQFESTRLGKCRGNLKESDMSLNEVAATLGVVFMFFSIFGLIAYNVYKSPDDTRRDADH